MIEGAVASLPRKRVHLLGLKKPGDFTMAEGHGYSLVYLYNILGGHLFHPSVSSFVSSYIHPSLRRR
jgi:hypothetical protein